MNPSQVLSVYDYLKENVATISIKEQEAIQILLESICAGNAEQIISDAGLVKFKKALTVKKFFEQNPTKYIFVLGAFSGKKNTVVETARKCGIPKNNIKFFSEYSQLKKHDAAVDAQKKDVLAVILGSTPHNTQGGSIYTSLKQQLETELNTILYYRDSLKLSKNDFSNFFKQITQKML